MRALEAALWELETKLSELHQYRGIGLGPLLNDILLIHVWNRRALNPTKSLASLATSVVRLLRANALRRPSLEVRNTSAHQGKVLFSWISNKPHLAGLVRPVVNRLGPDKACVICLGAEAPSGLDPGVEVIQAGSVENLGRPTFGSILDLLGRTVSDTRGFSREQGLGAAFDLLVAGCLIDGVRWVEAFLEFLPLLGPSMIVVEFDRHSRTVPMVLAANSLQIPTATLQHGMVNLGYGYLPLVADRILTWGDVSNNRLIEFGLDPFRATPVGCPAIAQASPLPRGEALSSLGLPRDRPLIVMATNPMRNSERKRLVELFGYATEALGDAITPALRPHPSENPESFAPLLSCFPRIRILPPEMKDETVAAMSILVCQGTGFALEVAASATPVVAFDVLEERELGAVGDMANCGGCITADSSESLAQTIRDLLGDQTTYQSASQAAKQYSEKCFYSLGEEAAANVGDLIAGATARG